MSPVLTAGSTMRNPARALLKGVGAVDCIFRRAEHADLVRDCRCRVSSGAGGELRCKLGNLGGYDIIHRLSFPASTDSCAHVLLMIFATRAICTPGYLDSGPLSCRSTWLAWTATVV